MLPPSVTLVDVVGKIRIGKQKYSQQCVDAIFPGGSTDCKASAGAWVLHIFAFPWKLLFAIIPPVDIAGGWLTFFLSLLGIAGLEIVSSAFARRWRTLTYLVVCGIVFVCYVQGDHVHG